MSYSVLYVYEKTATTATLNLNDGEVSGVGLTVSLYNQAKTEVLQTGVTDSEGMVTFTGLTPETAYNAYYEDAGYTAFTTEADSPKTALESQWVDLISRVKNSGGGGGGITVLTENSYIKDMESGVYLVPADVDVYRSLSSSPYTYSIFSQSPRYSDTEGGDSMALLIVGPALYGMSNYPRYDGTGFMCLYLSNEYQYNYGYDAQANVGKSPFKLVSGVVDSDGSVNDFRTITLQTFASPDLPLNWNTPTEQPLDANWGTRIVTAINGGDMTSYMPQLSVLAWTTIGTASKYTKRAKVATVSVAETSQTITANTWTTLFTLPSDFAPTVDIYSAATVSDGTNMSAAQLKVDTNGAVQVLSPISATDVYGSIVFGVTN